ncbi:MAG: MATE family efflux transporter [Bacteroidales bacterium]|nr:MATE family efflux transporter [Bacteroidales bacterium]
MRIELSGHYGYRRIVRTMLPVVAMMLVTSIYSVVDGLFISNFIGSTTFAAMNIIWPVLAIIGALGLMLGSGGSALVSKTFGEGRPERACEIFSMVVHIAILFGIAIAAVTFILMPQIVVALGSQGEMIPYAVTYGRILTLSMPVFISQMMFQSFFMTAEKPQLGTRMSIISGCLNIGLDALFILVFGWGLTGAAIATAIALGVGGIYPLFFFSSKANRTQLQFANFERIDWRAMGRSCSNGLSEFVGNIAFNVVGIAYNWQLMRYIGEDGVSAYGILLYFSFILAALFIGYNTGMTQVIAYNYGAGNKAELRSLLRKSVVLIGIGGILITLLAELGAPFISRLFVGYDDALTELTTKALRLYMVSFLICGYNMFCSAWFTALNNGVVSATAAFARTLIFELSCIFILPTILGIDGIWLSVDVAEVFALILSVGLILGYRKRYGY